MKKKMKRFFAEVRLADTLRMTPREICQSLGCDPSDWRQAWAAARIYAEDGGQLYTEEEFLRALELEVPEIVRNAYREFASWKP